MVCNYTKIHYSILQSHGNYVLNLLYFFLTLSRSIFPPKLKPSSGLLISFSVKQVANDFAVIPFSAQLNRIFVYTDKERNKDFHRDHYRAAIIITFKLFTISVCKSFFLKKLNEFLISHVFTELCICSYNTCNVSVLYGIDYI